MAELLLFVSAALGGGVTIVAALILLRLLMPDLVAEVEQRLVTSARRSFGVGLVNLLFLGLLATILGQIGEFAGLIAALLILLLLFLATVGLASWTVILNQRLGHAPPHRASDMVRAGGLLVLAGLAPLIGWFVLTPLLMISGLGAAIMTAVQFRRSRAKLPDEPYS